jgi:DNA-binding Lrp family transcriptional regulator
MVAPYPDVRSHREQALEVHTCDPGVPWATPDEGVYVEAYVLIQTHVGDAEAAAIAISGLEGVVSVDVVTGPYDVIARVQAESVDALGKLVVSQIQLVDGITRTLTSPVVHL